MSEGRSKSPTTLVGCLRLIIRRNRTLDAVSKRAVRAHDSFSHKISTIRWEPRAAGRPLRLHPAVVSGQKSEDQRLAKKLRDVPNFQAPHQIKPMNFGRAHADIQMIRDLAVRQPFGHETQNFQLSRRQQMLARRRPSGLSIRTSSPPLNGMSSQGAPLSANGLH